MAAIPGAPWFLQRRLEKTENFKLALIGQANRANRYRGTVFSFQFSVFSTKKTRWYRGLLAAHASPTVVDKPPMVPGTRDQLGRTYWVGLDGSKLGKEVGTTLHIPENANTSQHNSGTCRYMPEHAGTCPHGPRTAFSEAQAIV
jgi:hypothetical protein